MGTAPERTFDAGEFDDCVDSRRTRTEVDFQTQQGRAMGVTSTPTFLINGRIVRGAQSIDILRRVIAGVRDGG